MKKVGLICLLLLFILSLCQLCMADDEEKVREAGDVNLYGSFKTGLFTPADKVLRPETFWTYGFEVEGDIVLHDRLTFDARYYYLTGSDANFNPTGNFSMHNLDGKFSILISKEENIYPLNVWLGVKYLRMSDNTVAYGDDKADFTGFGFGLEKKPNPEKTFDFNFRVGYYPVMCGGGQTVDSLDAFDFEIGGNYKLSDNFNLNTSYFYERWNSDVETQYLEPTYGIKVGEGQSTLKGLRIGVNYTF